MGRFRICVQPSQRHGSLPGNHATVVLRPGVEGVPGVHLWGMRRKRQQLFSQHKCQERCVKVTDAEGRKGSESESRSESRCKLPQETGPCRAAFQKFHFDSESGTCKEFIYGGCDGNENRFDSNEDCLRACKKTT